MRVFECKMLRETFGPIKEVVTVGQRKLHNEDLYNFLPFTFRVIK